MVGFQGPTDQGGDERVEEEGKGLDQGLEDDNCRTVLRRRRGPRTEEIAVDFDHRN